MKKLIAFLTMTSLSLFVIAWCGSKNTIQPGELISITYTATFSNGEIFDKNTEKTPLMFMVGSGQTIKGLDNAVVGMKVGKTKTITITPEEWYGSLYNTMLVQKIGKLIFDKLNITPDVGSVQKLDKLEWVIKGIESDGSGNDFVLFDINPKETRDTLTYKITVLARDEVMTKK